MKPTRGLSNPWLSHMPRERKTALISLAVLAGLLGSLIAYQRFTATAPAPRAEIAGESLPGQITPGVEPDVVESEIETTPTAAAGVTEPAEPLQLLRPLRGEPTILQPYAVAFSEAYGDFRFNPGVDYEAQEGDSVLAAAAGRVVSIEEHPGDGLVVVLDHGNTAQTRYAGLRRILVQKEALVQQGTILAEVGQPGPARKELGTHLHFEVWEGGEPADPVAYLPTE